jgi:flavin-dependent dehydrogenase
VWVAIVAGAGPAGSLAAITLARRGHRVLLADKVADRAEKAGDHAGPIGEALPEAAGRLLRSLDLPVLDSGAHATIGGILSSWSSDELIAIDAFRHPDGRGWRLDRARFDADLRAAAVAAGATWRADRMRSVRRLGEGWEVGFEDGRVEHARWIVDATGRNRLLARRLGVSKVRGPRLVAVYARGRADALRTDRTLIEAVPEGWWYAARLPSGAPIAGFHTDARTAAGLRSDARAWARGLSRTRHIARLLEGSEFDEKVRAVDARGGRLAEFSGPGWIACGDAAMCFDPVSGQGIFSALHGGVAAGNAIIAALDGRSDGLDGYAKQMTEIWAIYQARLRTLYRNGHRWPASEFWTTVEHDLH